MQWKVPELVNPQLSLLVQSQMQASLGVLLRRLMKQWRAAPKRSRGERGAPGVVCKCSAHHDRADGNTCVRADEGILSFWANAHCVQGGTGLEHFAASAQCT